MPVVFDTEAFEASFLKLKGELHTQLFAEWLRTADEARGSMVNSGYKSRTGELAKGMWARVWEDGYCAFHADVVAGAYHALWVDQPTKAHWVPKNERRRTFYAAYQPEEGAPNVYVRNKKGTGVKRRRHKMLRWFVNGKAHFAKRVWIPASQGAHFTDRMAESYAELFPNELQAVADAVIQASDG